MKTNQKTIESVIMLTGGFTIVAMILFNVFIH